MESKKEIISRFLNTNGQVTISEVTRNCNVTAFTATKWLFVLCAENKATFERKGKIYLFTRVEK